MRMTHLWRRLLTTMILVPFVIVALGAGRVTGEPASEDERDPLFHEDFDERDALPEGMLVLDGTFEVAREDGSGVLRLWPEPLAESGVMFGPVVDWPLEVEARVYATRRGRLRPRFGVGLGGIMGARLRVAAANDRLELVLDDRVVAEAPYEWSSGAWTALRLRLTETEEGRWVARGRAWPADEQEPDSWPIRHELDDPPFPDQAAIWATPYAGTPIDFDHIVLRRPRDP